VDGSLEIVLCAAVVIWSAYLVIFLLDRSAARQIQSHCSSQPQGGVSPVRRAHPRSLPFLAATDDSMARLSAPFRGIGRRTEGIAQFFSNVPFVLCRSLHDWGDRSY
jgi:hypothetical protein